jgi:hypothetical protein
MSRPLRRPPPVVVLDAAGCPIRSRVRSSRQVSARWVVLRMMTAISRPPAANAADCALLRDHPVTVVRHRDHALHRSITKKPRSPGSDPVGGHRPARIRPRTRRRAAAARPRGPRRSCPRCADRLALDSYEPSARPSRGDQVGLQEMPSPRCPRRRFHRDPPATCSRGRRASSVRNAGAVVVVLLIAASAAKTTLIERPPPSSGDALPGHVIRIGETRNATTPAHRRGCRPAERVVAGQVLDGPCAVGRPDQRAPSRSPPCPRHDVGAMPCSLSSRASVRTAISMAALPSCGRRAHGASDTVLLEIITMCRARRSAYRQYHLHQWTAQRVHLQAATEVGGRGSATNWPLLAVPALLTPGRSGPEIGAHRLDLASTGEMSIRRRSPGRPPAAMISGPPRRQPRSPGDS